MQALSEDGGSDGSGQSDGGKEGSASSSDEGSDSDADAGADGHTKKFRQASPGEAPPAILNSCHCQNQQSRCCAWHLTAEVARKAALGGFMSSQRTCGPNASLTAVRCPLFCLAGGLLQMQLPSAQLPINCSQWQAAAALPWAVLHCNGCTALHWQNSMLVLPVWQMAMPTRSMTERRSSQRALGSGSSQMQVGLLIRMKAVAASDWQRVTSRH